jgi:DNA invertase Pin-like site-specific DNA recombinase
MKSIVGYCRVSTKRQARKGWSLAAQEVAIRKYAKKRGFRVRKIYTEQASGAKEDRPQLQAAIAHVKRSRCILLVSKIDRLTRSAGLLRDLEKSKVRFKACDNPHASKLTIHLMALLAEHELELIQDRIKTGLKQAKKCGVKLGRPDHLASWLQRHPGKAKAAQRKGAEANRQKAVEMYATLTPKMIRWRETMTLQAIANRLNGDGETTQSGSNWTATSVHRVLSR